MVVRCEYAHMQCHFQEVRYVLGRDVHDDILVWYVVSQLFQRLLNVLVHVLYLPKDDVNLLLPIAHA